jgi:hypothetical protein
MATHHRKGKPERTGESVARTRTAPGQRSKSKGRPDSVLRRRWRKRLTVIVVALAAINGLTWLITDDWRTRWIVLTVSVLAVPVLITVFWDPEGRGQLGDL